MKQSKRAVLVFFAFVLLFFLAGGFRLLVNGRDFLTSAGSLLSCVLILLWAVSVQRRVIERTPRVLFFAIAVCFVAYHFLQCCNYTFFAERPAIYHMVCLAYYIPLTLLPLFAFYAMLSAAGPDSRRIRIILAAVTAPAALLLIAGFLTDDLHALAFPGGPDGGLTTRGPLYWAFLVYFAVLVCAGLAFVLIRCGRRRRFARLAAVLLPVILGLLLGVLFFTGNNPAIGGVRVWNLGDLLAFPAVCYFELCIQTGLVPSNRAYGRLLSQEVFRLRICDASGAVRLSSAGFPAEPPEHFRQRSLAIRGGSVRYLTDLTQVERLTAEISETMEAVRMRNEYLKAENRRLAEKHSLEAKTEIYSRIAETVRCRTQSLLRLPPDCPDAELKQTLAYAALLGVYIKRRSNLALLAADTDTIPASELLTALQESAEYLSLAGIRTSVSLPRDFPCDIELLTDAYEFFSEFAEACPPGEGTLCVSIREAGRSPELRLLYCIPGLTRMPKAADSPVRRVCTVTPEGADTYLTMRPQKGGESV